MSKKLTLMYDKALMSTPFAFEPSLEVDIKKPTEIVQKIKQRLLNDMRTNPNLQRLVDIFDTRNYDFAFEYTDPYAAVNNEPLVIEKIIKTPKNDDIVVKIMDKNDEKYDYTKINEPNIHITDYYNQLYIDENMKETPQSGGKKNRASKKTSKRTSKKSSKKVVQAGGKKKSSKKTSKKTSKRTSKKSSRK